MIWKFWEKMHLMEELENIKLWNNAKVSVSEVTIWYYELSVFQDFENLFNAMRLEVEEFMVFLEKL